MAKGFNWTILDGKFAASKLFQNGADIRITPFKMKPTTNKAIMPLCKPIVVSLAKGFETLDSGQATLGKFTWKHKSVNYKYELGRP